MFYKDDNDQIHQGVREDARPSILVVFAEGLTPQHTSVEKDTTLENVGG